LTEIFDHGVKEYPELGIGRYFKPEYVHFTNKLTSLRQSKTPIDVGCSLFTSHP